ncbi:MAG: zf-HC2 domain-containing protein [Clostridia bacterium]|nr:zf-HC2 domain-containing protein [Clostridia bacterium]
MKLNNRDCKIVQDLLPNYIENLTDEITNEYIEEHIATCAECAQVLKDMNGELKLEQIHQEHEIKYLKGIRKRVRRTILAVTIAIILIAGCVIGYVYKKSQIQVNNYTFLRADYIIENEEGKEDGKVYGSVIAVFNEREICVSMRVVEDYDEDRYLGMKKSKDNYTNLKLINNTVYYNTNRWNGHSKEEVKEYWITNYPIKTIEEI